MSNRPSRMTVERYRLLYDQAKLRAQVLTLKELEAETGFCATYCQQIMAKVRKGLNVKVTVSHETNSDTLTTGRTVTPARSGSVAPSAPTERGPKIP